MMTLRERLLGASVFVDILAAERRGRRGAVARLAKHHLDHACRMFAQAAVAEMLREKKRSKKK